MVLAVTSEQSNELIEPRGSELTLLLSTRCGLVSAFLVNGINLPLDLLRLLRVDPGIMPINVGVSSCTSTDDGQDIFRTVEVGI